MPRHEDAEMSHNDIVQALEREAVHVVNTVNTLSTTELEALLAVRRRHDADARAQTAHRRASSATLALPATSATLAYDTGLSWVITFLSLLSSLLIIEHLSVGFVCSLVSNTLWVARAYGKRDWPQLLLFVISLGLSVMGLISWVR